MRGLISKLTDSFSYGVAEAHLGIAKAEGYEVCELGDALSVEDEDFDRTIFKMALRNGNPMTISSMAMEPLRILFPYDRTELAKTVIKLMKNEILIPTSQIAGQSSLITFLVGKNITVVRQISTETVEKTYKMLDYVEFRRIDKKMIAQGIKEVQA